MKKNKKIIPVIISLSMILGNIATVPVFANSNQTKNFPVGGFNVPIYTDESVPEFFEIIQDDIDFNISSDSNIATDSNVKKRRKRFVHSNTITESELFKIGVNDIADVVNIENDSKRPDLNANIQSKVYPDGYNYSKLNNAEKIRYNVIKYIVEHADNNEFNMYFDGDAMDSKPFDDLETAFAFYYDNPEYFWFWQRLVDENGHVYSPYYYSQRSKDDGTVNDFVRLKQAITSEESQKVSELIDARDLFYNELKTDLNTDDLTTIPRAVLELKVHDKLLDWVEYNNGNIKNNADEHTAYGALVNRQAVCDGYALAFKYLLDGLDIDSVFLAGYVGNVSKKNGHAWNMVLLGSGEMSDTIDSADFYDVDPTWDDISNNKHQFFNLKTDTFNKNLSADNKHTRFFSD